MMLNNISIRTRFFLLLTFSVLFWLIAGFVALSLIDNLALLQQINREIGYLPQKILRLENSIHFFYKNDLPSESFQETGRSDGISRFNSSYLDTYTLLKELQTEPGFSRNYIIQQKVDKLLEYLNSSDGILETIVDKSRQRGWDHYGLNGILTDQMKNINMEGIPGIGQTGREFYSEAQFYLVSPESVRLNSLLNRIKPPG